MLDWRATDASLSVKERRAAVAVPYISRMGILLNDFLDFHSPEYPDTKGIPLFWWASGFTNLTAVELTMAALTTATVTSFGYARMNGAANGTASATSNSTGPRWLRKPRGLAVAP